MFESLNNLSLRFLLEQDEEGAGEESAPPATGSETPKEAPKEPVVEKPPLDIDMFTKKIARLVMNSRTLLQVEEVVVSRASEFLKKNKLTHRPNLILQEHCLPHKNMVHRNKTYLLRSILYSS